MNKETAEHFEAEAHEIAARDINVFLSHHMLLDINLHLMLCNILFRLISIALLIIMLLMDASSFSISKINFRYSSASIKIR
jgi:hypothetical protein